jgi:hypothetical protein
VVAFCQHKSSQAAAESIKNGTATWTRGLDLGLPTAFASYCIMRSTGRQEVLMNEMHQGSLRMEHQTDVMVRMTWWIMVMTGAVVLLSLATSALTIVQLYCH